jgi:predicted CopG family antitoxin
MAKTTISVDEDVKALLENLKGGKDWSSFLREMAEEYAALKREKVRKELKELFESSFEEIRMRKWVKEF